jgi:hypothetical protein
MGAIIAGPGAEAAITNYRTVLADLHATIEEMIAEGNTVSS